MKNIQRISALLFLQYHGDTKHSCSHIKKSVPAPQNVSCVETVTENEPYKGLNHRHRF
jgi:hypothetical protein